MNGNYFGLRSFPFEDRADTKYFYFTAMGEETLAAMENEILHDTGLTLLIGQAGTGKTLLLRALQTRLQESCRPVVLTCPENGKLNLVRECCKRFGGSFPTSDNQVRILNRLRRLLGRAAGAGFRSVLIVDQTENCSPSHIAELAMLAEMNDDRGKLLHIILAAKPSVRTLLDRPETPRIQQNHFREHVLSPLTAAETGEYIRHRLRVAGAGDALLFDDAAISRIHAVSNGFPRFINHICHAAMHAAHEARTSHITRAIVMEASARPMVRERTVDARNVGLAMTGGDRAPWLNVADAPNPTGPFDSATRPTDLLWDEEADETWSGAEVSSGASIVDGGCEVPYGKRYVWGPNNDPSVLTRLEQATARADRLAGTAEAALIRIETVEEQLSTTLEVSQAAVQRLNTMIDAAGRTYDALQKLVARAEADFGRLGSDPRATGHGGAERIEGLGYAEDQSVNQPNPVELERSVSRVPDLFRRSLSETAGGDLQVLSEPLCETEPDEPKAAKPPTRSEDIARLIEEAMGQEAPVPR